MAAIKLTAFSGERPLIIPRLLPDTASQSAIDTRMDDGSLSPLNRPIQTSAIDDENHKTIYKHNGVWMSWADVVHPAPGPIASGRLYFTGDGVPKVNMSGTVYPLAVPRPASAPSVAASGSGTGDVFSRTYVYTYVTAWGEESEPSAASSIISWQSGKTITLSGFPATPTGRNITRQRFYRSQTGQTGTYYYFIAERDVSTSDYADNVPVSRFAEALPSASFNTPPDGLKGLTAMPNGMMAAFVDKAVYFCEPYQPHAWPEKYILTCDAEIVGLGAIGTALVVMTKAQPYIIFGSHPSSMAMEKLEANYPCINGRGIVDFGFAIAYPTHEGVVTVTANGAVTLVTVNTISKEKWLALSPQTMVAGQLSGRYVAFYNTTDAQGQPLRGAVLLKLNGEPDLVRTAHRATAVYFDVLTSALYFLAPGDTKVYQFDPPNSAAETMYWRSKEFWLTEPTNFSCILIDTDTQRLAAQLEAQQELIDQIEEENAALFTAGLLGAINDEQVNLYPINGDAMVQVAPALNYIDVGVYADGEKIAVVQQPDRVVRLPSGFRARKWEIDVSGDIQVNQIAMATTVDELKSIL